MVTAAVVLDEALIMDGVKAKRSGGSAWLLWMRRVHTESIRGRVLEELEVENTIHAAIYLASAAEHDFLLGAPDIQ